MFKIRIFLFILLLPFVGFAQSDGNLNPSISWDYGKGYVKTFDLNEKRTTIEYFLEDTWLPAIFVNKEGTIGEKEYLTKFDILNNQVDVNINGKTMVAPMGIVKGFTMQTPEGDRTFMAFKPDNWNKPATYFEIIADGEIQLLVYHFAKNVGGNYNPAIDAGSRSSKIMPKEEYYILVDNKIEEVPKKRKAGERLFADFSKSKTYFSKNKVKFKSKNDLIELVNFLNKK